MPPRAEQYAARCITGLSGARQRELAFVITCAKPSPETAEIAPLSSSSLDWNYILELASRHGTVGFLARGIDLFPENVPAWVLRSVDELLSATVRRNLLLAAELLHISDALNASGVEHVVYKGTVLGEYLYGTIAVRTTSDIDLLVRPEDRVRAIACLQRIGFTETYNLTRRQMAAAIHFGFEHTFRRNGVVVDLHWHLVQPWAWHISTKTIWRHVLPFAFMGRTVQIFSPELMLASLCIHSAQHDWDELRMFADIAMLITRNPKLDWGMVESFTPDTHSRRNLHLALSLVHTHFNVELPIELTKRIQGDQFVTQLAANVYEGSWPSARDSAPDHLDLGWLLQRTTGEATRDRLRYLCGAALVPTLADFQTLKFPRPLHWLYFVLRPARIILQRARALFSD